MRIRNIEALAIILIALVAPASQGGIEPWIRNSSAMTQAGIHWHPANEQESDSLGMGSQDIAIFFSIPFAFSSHVSVFDGSFASLNASDHAVLDHNVLSVSAHSDWELAAGPGVAQGSPGLATIDSWALYGFILTSDSLADIEISYTSNNAGNGSCVFELYEISASGRRDIVIADNAPASIDSLQLTPGNYVISLDSHYSFAGEFGPFEASMNINVRVISPNCSEDINGDDAIDAADLGLLISAFGSSEIAADINSDGIVDAADLGLAIASFGSVCTD